MGCSQVLEGQSGHRPLWLVPCVCCARWERVPLEPSAAKRVGATESWAVQEGGNEPDRVMSSLGGWGPGLTLSGWRLEETFKS